MAGRLSLLAFSAQHFPSGSLWRLSQFTHGLRLSPVAFVLASLSAPSRQLPLAFSAFSRRPLLVFEADEDGVVGVGRTGGEVVR